MLNKRLVQTFSRLVQIDSVSKNETRFHTYLFNSLNDLGLVVREDDSRNQTKLGGNNIVATLVGNMKNEPLFFSCHTDTVPPGEGIEVEEIDGNLYSKGETILGADDKAGIAIILEAIKQIQDQSIPHGTIEFVFCPGEEIGLIGSSALDMSLIEAKNGYVLDSGGPVGHVTIASPTLYMYEVIIEGQAAHAGIEPEKGVSVVDVLAEALPAIKTGRLDDTTTANIGLIKGGEATNVVLDHLIVKGEIRAVDIEKAHRLIQEMTSAFQQASEKHGAAVTINTSKMATGFDISDDEPVMKLLLKSAENLEHEVMREVSGGGSDANVFNEKGKRVVNLSIGYENIHTTDEYIPIIEMERAVQLVIELIKNSPTKVE